MAREIKERQIGAHTYRIKQLGGRKATAALERIVKVFGPSVAPAVEGLLTSDNYYHGLLIGTGDGLSAICRTLPDGALWELVEMLGSDNETTVVVPDKTQPDGIREPVLRVVADDLWSGDTYGEMYQWLAFAIEVHFAGFFAGGSGRWKTALGRVRNFYEQQRKAEAKAE